MDIQSLFGLSGKVALVTGGATGIGRMAAEALVRAGAHVLLASRKEGACEAVAAELNALDTDGSAEGFVGDVGSKEGIEALVAEVTGDLLVVVARQRIRFLRLMSDPPGLNQPRELLGVS